MLLFCPKEDRGAGLLEALAILVIWTILAAVAFTGWAGYRRQAALQEAAWRLAGDLRLAQQLALAEGATHRLEFYLTLPKYKIIYPDSSYELVSLPPGIKYCFNTFPEIDNGCYRTAYFLASGAPNSGGTVGFVNEQGETLYVIVTPATGRLRISPVPPDDREDD